MNQLECRIPISPTPGFLTRTKLLAASIHQHYPNAIIRAYVGQRGGPRVNELQMVDTALKGYGIEWIGREEFDRWDGTRSPYIATMNRRFRSPVSGTHVLILDADVICMAPLPELFDVDAVQGVQAHVAPIDDRDWRMLFRLFGLKEPFFMHPYSGNGIMGPIGKMGPAYPNSGMVFAPRHLFERLCDPYHEAIGFLRGLLADTYWFDQIALALAIAKSEVPYRSLSPRFNFPNQPGFDKAYPADLSDVRFLHYLRLDVVDRDREFEDVGAMRRLAWRPDLAGSNEALRKRVAELIGVFEPASLACVEDAPWA